ncbi:hypothetical protein DFJ73DRAFT_810140 [Zopfochytrium polystomum]|nr:hypothetical protein DFJ73DRAFT_810140 [Zopfochytrium polystomum]
MFSPPPTPALFPRAETPPLKAAQCLESSTSSHASSHASSSAKTSQPAPLSGPAHERFLNPVPVVTSFRDIDDDSDASPSTPARVTHSLTLRITSDLNRNALGDLILEARTNDLVGVVANSPNGTYMCFNERTGEFGYVPSWAAEVQFEDRSAPNPYAIPGTPTTSGGHPTPNVPPRESSISSSGRSPSGNKRSRNKQWDAKYEEKRKMEKKRGLGVNLWRSQKDRFPLPYHQAVENLIWEFVSKQPEDLGKRAVFSSAAIQEVKSTRTPQRHSGTWRVWLPASVKSNFDIIKLSCCPPNLTVTVPECVELLLNLTERGDSEMLQVIEATSLRDLMESRPAFPLTPLIVMEASVGHESIVNSPAPTIPTSEIEISDRRSYESPDEFLVSVNRVLPDIAVSHDDMHLDVSAVDMRAGSPSSFGTVSHSSFDSVMAWLAEEMSLVSSGSGTLFGDLPFLSSNSAGLEVPPQLAAHASFPGTDAAMATSAAASPVTSPGFVPPPTLDLHEPDNWHLLQQQDTFYRMPWAPPPAPSEYAHQRTGHHSVRHHPFYKDLHPEHHHHHPFFAKWRVPTKQSAESSEDDSVKKENETDTDSSSYHDHPSHHEHGAHWASHYGPKTWRSRIKDQPTPYASNTKEQQAQLAAVEAQLEEELLSGSVGETGQSGHMSSLFRTFSHKHKHNGEEEGETGSDVPAHHNSLFRTFSHRKHLHDAEGDVSANDGVESQQNSSVDQEELPIEKPIDGSDGGGASSHSSILRRITFSLHHNHHSHHHHKDSHNNRHSSSSSSSSTDSSSSTVLAQQESSESLDGAVPHTDVSLESVEPDGAKVLTTAINDISEGPSDVELAQAALSLDSSPEAVALVNAQRRQAVIALLRVLQDGFSFWQRQQATEQNDSVNLVRLSTDWAKTAAAKLTSLVESTLLERNVLELAVWEVLERANLPANTQQQDQVPLTLELLAAFLVRNRVIDELALVDYGSGADNDTAVPAPVEVTVEVEGGAKAVIVSSAVPPSEREENDLAASLTAVKLDSEPSSS